MRLREKNLIDEIENDALRSDVPVADVLRKLMALGGKAGSSELRDWASRELRGYDGSGVELPEYRKPAAAIQINGANMRAIITGQQISPRQLPDVVSKHIGEEVPLTQSIGEIEAMLEQAKSGEGYLKLTLPKSQDIVALMNHDNSESYTQITAVYWTLGQSALQGVIDRVKTTLVELVAEMRAGMPDEDDIPTAAVADHAVNFVVNGEGARINVNTSNVSGDGSNLNTAQVSGDGSHTVTNILNTKEGRSIWVKVGAAIVGIATIAGSIFGLAQWQDWSP